MCRACRSAIPIFPGGGNWEGEGVEPTIKVAPGAALDRALEAASTALAARAEGVQKTEYSWAAKLNAARVTRVVQSRPLDAFAGRYGERTVRVDRDKLLFQRDGGRLTPLVPIGPDLFALDLDPRARVRFAGASAVTGLTIERVDGSTSAAARN